MLLMPQAAQAGETSRKVLKVIALPFRVVVWTASILLIPVILPVELVDDYCKQDERFDRDVEEAQEAIDALKKVTGK